MDEFRWLQARLGAAHAVNTADSTTPHTVVVLPSFSVGESLLSHYADRLPALEHTPLAAEPDEPAVGRRSMPRDVVISGTEGRTSH